MKTLRCLLALMLLWLPVHTGADCIEPPPGASTMEIGSNLVHPAFYASNLMFADVGHSAGPPGPCPDADQNEACDINSSTSFLIISGNRYPGGDYTVTFDGTGTLHKGGQQWFPCRPWERPGSTHANPCPTDNTTLTIPDPPTDSQTLIVWYSDPNDPVRNISIRFPGETGLFNTPYLATLQNVPILRFMDAALTNCSPLKEWNERTVEADWNWGQEIRDGGSGIPYEVMIDLLDETGAQGWFTLPHQASDDFATKFGQLLAARGVTSPIIELSNEIWNDTFNAVQTACNEAPNPQDDAQRTWFITQQDVVPQPAELTSHPEWDGQGFFRRDNWNAMVYAKRAMEVCGLVKVEVPSALCVLSGQAAVPSRLDNSLWALHTETSWGLPMPDAIAAAPYFGQLGEFADGYNFVSEVFSDIDTISIPDAVSNAQALVDTASEWSVTAGVEIEPWAYEGGHHLVSNGVPHVFEDVQRHPDMRARYDFYLSEMERVGIKKFVHFNGTGNWGGGQFWGEREFLGDVTPKSQSLEAARTRAAGAP